MNQILLGVKEENGWLNSRWNLTYRIGWERICKAVYSSYDFYNNPEIMLDGKLVEVKKMFYVWKKVVL